VRPYVTAGIIIAVLLSGAALWAAHDPLIGERAIFALQAQEWFYRLASPGCAIGLALLVLAWVERDRPGRRHDRLPGDRADTDQLPLGHRAPRACWKTPD
jgi:hypothetical protein